jgi:hypothetical protein
VIDQTLGITNAPRQAGRNKKKPKSFAIEQRELIDLMVWWVFPYLVPPLDELDGVEVLGVDVPDQLGHPEVSGPDVPDHLVPLHPLHWALSLELALAPSIGAGSWIQRWSSESLKKGGAARWTAGRRRDGWALVVAESGRS